MKSKIPLHPRTAKEMAPMPTPRHGTGAVTINNVIYMPGGGLTVGGSQPTAVNEAFSLT
jgi:hypothetical protein